MRTRLPAFVCVMLICSLFPLYSDALCTKVRKTNVRNGPGTSYKVGWQVYMYMPFEKIGVSTSGKWYAVKDVDGDIFWIHKDMVTSGHKCAVVKVDEVRVRTGPGKGYAESKEGPAKRYYSYKVLKTRGRWVNVRDEWGHTGWIGKDFLWVR